MVMGWCARLRADVGCGYWSGRGWGQFSYCNILVTDADSLFLPTRLGVVSRDAELGLGVPAEALVQSAGIRVTQQA